MRHSILVIAAVLLGKATAFWEYGHLYVARIAYDQLQKTPEGQAALSSANQMLSWYQDENTAKEGNYPFVECAVFGDLIKDPKDKWQSKWHYVDTPFSDDDTPLPPLEEENAETAIEGILAWLTNEGDYQNHFAYQKVMAHANHDEAQARSYALRLIIHYIGDIHQPLHAVARVTKKHKKGDGGGNSFIVPVPEDMDMDRFNLHMVWDSAVFLYPGRPNLPFSQAAWKTLGKNAASMETEFSFRQSQWANVNVHKWAQESFNIARKNVYQLTEGEEVPIEYIRKNQIIIKELMVKAGLRLSYVIQHIFSNSASF